MLKRPHLQILALVTLLAGCNFHAPTIFADGLDPLHPTLAFDGEHFGVAWQDVRSVSGFQNTDLWFAVVNEDGDPTLSPRVLHSPGEALSDSAWTPTILSTGEDFAVFWLVRGSVEGGYYYARVAADGTIKVAPKRVAADLGTFVTRSGKGSSHAFQWTGEEFGMLWYRDDGDVLSLMFSRLDLDGNLLAEPRVIDSPVWNEVGPTLAWTGSRYGAAWFINVAGQDAELRTATISPDGEGPVEPQQITAALVDTLALQWNGHGFGLLWGHVVRLGPGGFPEWEHRFVELDENAQLQSEVMTLSESVFSFARPLSLLWTGDKYIATVVEKDSETFRLDFPGARGPVERKKIVDGGQTDIPVATASASDRLGATWALNEEIFFITDEL
jgi:hypothetical protein